MKSIFYNAEQYSLRTGWRMAIFIAISSPIMLVASYSGKQLLTFFPILNMISVKLLFLYIGLTISSFIVLKYIDKRPFVSVGLSLKANVVREFGQGLALGFCMMSIVFVTEYSFGMVTIHLREISIIEVAKVGGYSFSLYCVVGYGEEMLFRGYLFQTFIEGTNKFAATGIFSLLFGAAHLANPNSTILASINITLAGIWLSMAYLKTQSLWLPIGLHISWNFTQGFIFMYPVSGTTSLKEQIGTAVVTGPEWFTGGAFGPEGGLLATIVILITFLCIYFSKTIYPSKNIWNHDVWLQEQQQTVHLQKETAS